jgi:hypothetical protein
MDFLLLLLSLLAWMWSRQHNCEETPVASSAEDLFAFSLCPSVFCAFSFPPPPAFSKCLQTPLCFLLVISLRIPWEEAMEITLFLDLSEQL